MHVVLFGAVVALLVYFSPAPMDETIVLLPDPDGKVGVVIVERGGERTVLDRPYAASRTAVPGAERLEPQSVRREFGDALSALPPRPTSYVLYFVTGLDELTDDSKAELKRLLAELRRRPQSDILVIGHTDRVGSDASNDQLSLQRAERVRAELLGLGIVESRLRLAGRGEREPIVPTADGIEEPRNRRVEVNVR
jgi:outer membrane protein OmpA-like peptidoglycan-associated protein